MATLFTVGVLNELDDDYETAKDLGLSYKHLFFFSHFRYGFKESLNSIEKADIVILTSMSIGSENLKNINIGT